MSKTILNRIYESTFIYALLVFIGYYNLHIFYLYFDVEISKFLEIQELLLSFLPFTFPIIILILTFGFFTIMPVVKIALDIETPKEIDNKDYDFVNRITNSVKIIKRVIKEKKWKSSITYFNLFVFSFQLVVSIGIFIFLFLFLIHFIDRIFGDSYFNTTVGLLLLLSILWISLFDAFIKRAFKNVPKLKDFARIFLIFIFSICLISIENKDKAENILIGKPLYEVEFAYDNNKVNTDSNLVFVGQTNKYLFLRNLKEEQNYIYRKENIGILKMIVKNKSDKPK